MMNLTDIINAAPGAYAGIGSRETPSDILQLMERLSSRLANLGWTLRSGCAPGADTAFEVGAPPGARVELYQPWPSFGLDPKRGPVPALRASRVRLRSPSDGAYEIAAKYHPYWNRMRSQDKPLHARNSHQVLGADLDDSSKFILCYTADGADNIRRQPSRITGGTGQAIRVARGYNVPVFNLFWPDVAKEVERIVGC